MRIAEITIQTPRGDLAATAGDAGDAWRWACDDAFLRESLNGYARLWPWLRKGYEPDHFAAMVRDAASFYEGTVTRPPDPLPFDPAVVY